MKLLHLGILLASSFLLVLPGEGKEGPPLSSLGKNPGVTREDLLYRISEETGGERLMAELLLARMVPEEKEKLVERLTDTLVLEMAARMSGLDLQEDLRLRIKWERADLLARAYLERLTERWDFSEDILRDYYESHKEDYDRDTELCLSCYCYASEEDARRALMASLGNNPSEVLPASDYSRRIPLGWVSSEDVSRKYRDIFLSPDVKPLLGPLEASEGEYLLICVDNRLDSRSLSFEEARGQVREDLEMTLLEEELQELRKRFGVRLHRREIRHLQPYEF